MDALKVLKSDHDTVRELFSQFKKAKEADDTERMQSVQQKIFSELEVHTSIEEEVFYPAAKDAGEDAEELIAEGIEEHHVVDVLMGEIRGLQPDDDAWAAKMTVLIENVEHHADEEEEELFPQLRKVFGDEQLEQLGSALQQAKERRVGPSAAAETDLTRDELYEKAKAADVAGRSNMNKDELADAVGEDAT